jgi:hypothetical protein
MGVPNPNESEEALKEAAKRQYPKTEQETVLTIANPLIAESGSKFLKKGTQIISSSIVLLQILDRCVNSIKLGVSIIQTKTKALMGHLESKMTFASKEFQKGNKHKEKFDQLADDVDGYVQRNLVDMNHLESLMRKYARTLLKIESLRPIQKNSSDLLRK